MTPMPRHPHLVFLETEDWAYWLSAARVAVTEQVPVAALLTVRIFPAIVQPVDEPML